MTGALKNGVSALAQLLVMPLIVAYHLARIVRISRSFFLSTSQFLSLFPGKSGTYLRSAYYRWVCTDVSVEASIGFLTTFSHEDTDIGSGVYIGPYGNIGMCSIGDNCLLGTGVHLLSGNQQHSFSDPDTPMKDQQGTYTKINIGEDTWIGNQAIIMADVGSRCVVAAGAVVIKPVADNCIVAGNPAKVISHTQKGGAADVHVENTGL